jgi:large subunit ribosomal protein L4
MKAAALRGALSDRARHGRIHVLSALVEGDAPSAKTAATVLGGLSERKNLLVVIDRADVMAWKSVRNLENVHVLVPDQLNTYDVLCADEVVFTEGALSTFLAGPVKGKAAVEAEVAVEVEEAPEAPKAKKPAKKAAAKKAESVEEDTK